MSTNQTNVIEVEPTTELDNAEPSIYVFVGLPGSGKTTAVGFAKEQLREDGTPAVYHEVSGKVRDMYHKTTGDWIEISDNDLGKWAAEMKEEYGNHVFVKELAHDLDEEWNTNAHIISGVRSPAEADAIRDVFDDVTVITLWSMPDIRFERLQERENNYTHEEFAERKKRELWDWDCIEFFTNEDQFDYIVPNNFDMTAFESAVSNIVSGVEMYDEQPWPDMPSKKHVAQYL